MIQFECFYDDIDFMAALFYNNILHKSYIFEIANYLTKKISDDNLISIIVNGSDDDNNEKLFKNYLAKLKIEYLHPEKIIVAKIFYYILHSKIDIKEGIDFIWNNVRVCKDPRESVADALGISNITSKFYSICEGLAGDNDNITIFRKKIIKEMQEFIHDNLEQIN
jgi:hypothetical protein